MLETPGDMDCYVGGFPCQPFSISGSHQGLDDRAGRGHIIFHLLQYISEKKPVTFILENVPGLATMFPDTLASIVQYLRELRDSDGEFMYEVHWKVLDTSVHGGLPQHRPRLYIVGALRKHMCEPFQWPAPSAKVLNLSDVLDDASMLKMAEAGLDPTTSDAIINIGGTKPEYMVERCPCLTRTRCADLAFYSTKRLRTLTVNEMMALQGVKPE
eukprot:9497993-Pyramimonas_sp.AAC.1